MAENQKNDDLLDSILESIAQEGTIERKMDDFARDKERKRRIERARQSSMEFQQTYSDSSKNTEEKDDQTDAFNQEILPIGRDSGSQPEPAEAAGATRVNMPKVNAGSSNADEGATRVFSSAAPASPAKEEGGTVFMDQNEISNLLENDDQPLLNRAYLGSSNKSSKSRPEERLRTEYREQDYEEDYDDRHAGRGSAGINWKIPVAIIGAALCGLLIFGAVKMIPGWIGGLIADREEQTSRNFNDLKEWAQTIYSDDPADLKDILGWKSRFDKLSKDQQKQINEILEQATGKNFDQLVAIAQGADKAEKDNNNTQIAEQKAQIKQQIKTLQSQLDSKQSDLDKLNALLSTANQKGTDLTNAQTSLSSAQTKLNDLLNQKNHPQINPEYTAKENEIDNLRNQLAGLSSDDPRYDELSAQLDQAQRELSSINQYLSNSSLDSQISSAQSEVNSAQSAVNSAQSAYDSARSEYTNQGGDAMVSSLQSDISSLQSQINDLQSQLDELGK